MAEFRVEIKRQAARELEALEPRLARRILASIEALRSDPRPRQSRKLAGSKNSYRLKVGNCRILYQVDHPLHVTTVFAVGHRREIYR